MESEFDEACAKAEREIAAQGGYVEYRKRELSKAYSPPTAVAPAVMTAQEKTLEQLEKIAKLKGVSIEQYFAEHPADYAALRAMSYADKRG